MFYLEKGLVMTNYFSKETRIQYLILTLVFIVSIYPFLYMISTSLMTACEAANNYMFPSRPMYENYIEVWTCLVYTSPRPRARGCGRMPSSA